MQRGHLTELRPGHWRYRAPAPRTLDGRRTVHSHTFNAPNAKAAAKIATAKLAEWDAGDQARAAIRGTVREAVEAYRELRARDDSPTTLYRRKSILARIETDLGHIRLADLTAHHLDRWYTALVASRKGQRAITANTVRQYHATVRAVLALAWEYDRVPTNVAAKAHPPRVERHDQADRVPTPAALATMLATASPTVRLAVILGATTGARRGEIVGLRWSDLDGLVLTVSRSLAKVPGGKLIVKATKTGAVKSLPLPASVLALLEHHRGELAAWAAREGKVLAADGPILAHMRADATGRTPYAPDWLSQEWERLCDKHGVAFKFHGLRHMHGSLLADAGVPMASIAKRQGHGVGVLQDRYLHSVDATDVRAAEVIGELLAGAIGQQSAQP